jgi:tetratricopeptide (TPR) repeat protein
VTPATHAGHFALSDNAVDLNALLNAAETTSAPKRRSETVEVDLSVELNGIDKPPSGDLDTVFSQMRDDASRRAAMEAAESEYQRGVALHTSGDSDAAVGALQAAARAPRLRFAAASLAGRILRDTGRLPQAIESLERAAQAPAPTPEEGHLLLYELAEMLETTGETARALAVCLELQADAGDFRDLAARIERLAKVQARG